MSVNMTQGYIAPPCSSVKWTKGQGERGQPVVTGGLGWLAAISDVSWDMPSSHCLTPRGFAAKLILMTNGVRVIINKSAIASQRPMTIINQFSSTLRRPQAPFSFLPTSPSEHYYFTLS